MDEKSLLIQAKDYIEARIIHIKKKYEMIYSATKDYKKKEAFVKTISDMDKDLKKLASSNFLESDLKKYDITEQDLNDYIYNVQKPRADEYKILRNINIEKLNKFSINIEINSIWSYLNYFGKEYLGLLSEQNLKLDYGHSFQRDSFFTMYNQTIRALDDYGKILEEIDTAGINSYKQYKESLLKAQSKEYRDIVLRTGRFLYSLKTFITEINGTGGDGNSNLLEPSKVVEIKGENSSINGLTAKGALADLDMFLNEFIDFLKIPDLKKISEEDKS